MYKKYDTTLDLAMNAHRASTDSVAYIIRKMKARKACTEMMHHLWRQNLLSWIDSDGSKTPLFDFNRSELEGLVLFVRDLPYFAVDPILQTWEEILQAEIDMR